MIDVSGTVSRDLKSYIQRVANYLELDLYDPYYELSIVRSCSQDAGGYCHGDEDEIQIEIARYDGEGKIPLEEMKVNIAHEMIHAQQIASGRLVNDGFMYRGEGEDRHLVYSHTWEDEVFINLPYSDHPWELEAYSREQEVYEACR